MVDDVERYKAQAAERAVTLVQAGMVVGLGSGTTALYATRLIGKLLREGALTNIRGIPTSKAIANEARALDIPLLTDDLPTEIDLTIDGADEVNPDLDLIKGGGGALLREKIVAVASHRELIVVDDSKLVQRLGDHRSLPVEVIRFGWRRHAEYLRGLGASPGLRLSDNGAPFETDQGNYILDCAFGPIEDPPGLAARIRDRVGIVEHGLFIGLTSDVIVAGPDGIRHITRESV